MSPLEAHLIQLDTPDTANTSIAERVVDVHAAIGQVAQFTARAGTAIPSLPTEGNPGVSSAVGVLSAGEIHRVGRVVHCDINKGEAVVPVVPSLAAREVRPNHSQLLNRPGQETTYQV